MLSHSAASCLMVGVLSYPSTDEATVVNNLSSACYEHQMTCSAVQILEATSFDSCPSSIAKQ